MRVNGDVRESTSSFERFENGKLLTDFEGKLREKDIELGRFQEELDASRKSIEMIQRQYAETKETADQKDSLVWKLRREVDNMAEKLDQSQREKALAVEKLNSVQSDMSSLAVEKVCTSLRTGIGFFWVLEF